MPNRSWRICAGGAGSRWCWQCSIGPRVRIVDSLRGSRRGQRLIDLDQISYAWLPVHCTALGKLLLANLPDSEQRSVISELTLTRHMPQTITGKTALRAELQGLCGQSLAAADEGLARVCTRSPRRSVRSPTRLSRLLALTRMPR